MHKDDRRFGYYVREKIMKDAEWNSRHHCKEVPRCSNHTCTTYSYLQKFYNMTNLDAQDLEFRPREQESRCKQLSYPP